jgi:polysaccharide biosynthesis transport protein
MQNEVDRSNIRPLARSDGPLESSGHALNVEHLLAAIRRQLRLVISCAILGVLIGLAYAFTTSPLYTASTQILIDSTKGAGDQAAATTLADLQFDNGAIDSQVEVLKSDRIAKVVMEKLRLEEDPEFSTGSNSILPSIIKYISSWIGRTPTDEEAASADLDKKDSLRRKVIGRLQERLEVKRVRLTYLLDVQFTSNSPSGSAKISRAFANAYLDDQLDAKFDSARRSSDWLQLRIQELKENVLKTDLAVQTYRTKNNLVSTGTSGQLVSQQQVSDLSAQLTVARGETAKAQARFERINTIMESGQTDAAVSEALGNPVIVDLRNKLLKTSKTEADLRKLLGSKHQQVIQLGREIKQYETQIFGELNRISESYKSEAEIAKSRQSALEKDLNSLIGVNANSNETLVNLRELEREAETYKNLYQTFLQRYQESVQSQSFPVNEASIITADSRPLRPSHPEKGKILLFAALIGSIFGFMLAALREFKDRAIRTGEQVQTEIKMEFLGFLPAINPRKIVEREKANPAIVSLDGKSLRCPPMLRYSIISPLSSYAETLRTAKVACDVTLGSKRCKIIGIVSVLPREGKTTVAKNFASMIASHGSHTLLIDADLRNPGLSRSIAADVKIGLGDVLTSQLPWHDAMLHETETGLDIVPTAARRNIFHTSELLNSKTMREILEEAVSHYDYIIVDLPPLGPVVDVRATTHLFDQFIMVAHWGETSRRLLQTTLDRNPAIKSKVCGVILNRVDSAGMRRYETSGSSYYNYGSYSGYFQDEQARA